MRALHDDDGTLRRGCACEIEVLKFELSLDTVASASSKRDRNRQLLLSLLLCDTAKSLLFRGLEQGNTLIVRHALFDYNASPDSLEDFNAADGQMPPRSALEVCITSPSFYWRDGSWIDCMHLLCQAGATIDDASLLALTAGVKVGSDGVWHYFLLGGWLDVEKTIPDVIADRDSVPRG